MKALVLHYGVGNVFSVSHAFRRLGFEAVVSEKLRRDVDCLVMPGVGNFSPAAEKISSIREELVDFVMSGAPVLGICLGMQLFFEESEEGPGKGLGVFRGKVVGLPPTVKRPHMGWNIIRRTRQNPLLEDVENEWVYFNHSYHPSPADPNIILAEANYGISFPAVVGKNTIFGTQFHPEKSSTAGEKILRNFVKFVKR
ncbi:MAG: imidazole glycerol phosphate synthase subunit HisH [Candidatus Caldarchaeum sp.]|nr:imidazole glycerol phosphate synthase subunit HisH [Candidatus Caldarchaeum sp.]MDW8435596.1 imidazole glycerol phosphate synthase subunit HisH [Candidatus Caldarchaeum sp.]